MIDKRTIIITSLGRTGTKFFSELFDNVIADAIVLHEPDVFNFFQYQGTVERIKQIRKQIRESGASNLIVRKALGRWSLIELSDAKVRGELDYTEVVRETLRQRQHFVCSKKEPIYVEASIAYYGLVDVLKDVYRLHRVVYIIRDGRDWVRSQFNWGQMYNKSRIRSLIAHTWPTALELENDPYRSKWEKMSRFERLCWAWTKLNGYALDTVQKNPNAKVFRFEDIFNSTEGYNHLAELVRFTTALPKIEPVASHSLAGWLDQKIHRSEPEFPVWQAWPSDHKQQFEAICGPLMETLRYKF